MFIRVAVPADAADIADVHVRSWQETYRSLLPQGYLDALDPAQRIPSWQESLTTQTPPTVATVVITEDEVVFGFAHVCPTRDEDNEGSPVGEVAAIYLRPGTWRRGFGGQLMSRALDLLREAGNAVATLWVLQGNARAISYYEAVGRSADGTVKRARIAGVTVIELRYRIGL